MTHVFFVESVMRRTLMEFEDLGVTRILAHSEKAAAYMADGYARIAGKPGVCMAQSVGAANLASGLQDPYLGRSPVVALTGRKEPSFQHRNSYQEIAHAPLFAAVTKFSSAGQFDRPNCPACCAMPGARHWPTPRGQPISISAACKATSSSSAKPASRQSSIPRRRRIPAHRPVADSRTSSAPVRR